MQNIMALHFTLEPTVSIHAGQRPAASGNGLESDKDRVVKRLQTLPWLDAQRLTNGAWYDDLELLGYKYRFHATILQSRRKSQH